MAYTMEEVAKLARVSSSTVSRVLSKNPNISAATVERVMAAVEKLHYHRNVHARRLAIGKSDLFGLVISEIANPFFSEIIRGFQAAAWDRNFDVLLLNTEYDEKRADAAVKKLIENSVRGVAVITSSLPDTVISTLTSKGIAAVTFNPVPVDRLMSTITIDYKRGLVQAIEHVASLGHRRAAVIAGPETNRTACAIEQVLVKGLRQRGLDPDPVTHSNYHFDAGASAVRVILSARNAPTVIFCGSDLIAMGAIMALEEAGVDVPNEISIVGVDDLPFSFLIRPALTTIRVPREEIGKTAFAALEKLLKLKRKRGAEYIVETELVIRKSTAPEPKFALRKIPGPPIVQA
ncbi:MAG: DNA-binding transcriptional regulator CytR [Terriglobales bacterium]